MEIIKNSVFKFTDINPNSFIEDYMLEEEQDEKLLIKLIIQLRKIKFLISLESLLGHILQ